MLKTKNLYESEKQARISLEENRALIEKERNEFNARVKLEKQLILSETEQKIERFVEIEKDLKDQLEIKEKL